MKKEKKGEVLVVSVENLEKLKLEYEKESRRSSSSIDSPPKENKKLEELEKSINYIMDELSKAGQLPLFPESKDEKKQETKAYKRKVHVELVVRINGLEEKPVVIPLLNEDLPAEEAQYYMYVALNERRNKRRIEAALDLPIEEMPSLVPSIKEEPKEPILEVVTNVNEVF